LTHQVDLPRAQKYILTYATIQQLSDRFCIRFIVERHIHNGIEGSSGKNLCETDAVTPITAQTLNICWQLVRSFAPVQDGDRMSLPAKFQCEEMTHISSTANN
jgi:hypothetical protein